MIGRLNHIAIVVPDLDAAAAVYRDALGARVSPPQPLPSHELADRHRRLYPGLVGDIVRDLAALGQPFRTRRVGPRGRRAAPPLARAQIGADDNPGRDHLAWHLYRRQRAVVQLSRYLT